MEAENLNGLRDQENGLKKMTVPVFIPGNLLEDIRY